MLRALMTAAFVLLLSSFAHAQVRPTTVEFPASPDHSTVVSYALEMTEQGSTTLVFPRKDLQKPTPDANNKIGPIAVAEFAGLPAGPASNPKKYVATIVTIFPGALEVRSVQSDPFSVANPGQAAGKPVLK